jgi:hypothetical protein
MLTAEAIVGLITLANTIAGMFKGKAKFADGTVLTQEHIDAAKNKADAPWQRIENTAQAELDALDHKQGKPPTT